MNRWLGVTMRPIFECGNASLFFLHEKVSGRTRRVAVNLGRTRKPREPSEPSRAQRGLVLRGLMGVLGDSKVSMS